MSRLEHLENEVRTLSQEELKAFRDWFLRFDAESLAERAIRDHEGRDARLQAMRGLIGIRKGRGATDAVQEVRRLRSGVRLEKLLGQTDQRD